MTAVTIATNLNRAALLAARLPFEIPVWLIEQVRKLFVLVPLDTFMSALIYFMSVLTNHGNEDESKDRQRS